MTSFPSLFHPGVLLHRPVNLETAGDHHHDLGEKISSLYCSTLSILHFFLLSLLLGSIHNVSFALSQSHCSQHCQQWVTSILLMSSWNGMEWPSLHTGQVVGATGPGHARARVTWQAFRVIAVGAGQRVGLVCAPPPCGAAGPACPPGWWVQRWLRCSPSGPRPALPADVIEPGVLLLLYLLMLKC